MTQPNTSSPKPDLDFTEFDAKVSQFLIDNGLEGASAVVVHKDWGLVHTSGYGSYDADRVYLIASASKVLSVGVLMRLADQGKVDIDAPVGNYLKDWHGGDKQGLEVAQLVSNSSGLPSLLDNPFYVPYLCQYVDSGTLTDCAKAIYTTTADAAERKSPDTEFHYGGGQWQLAGGIAEQVGGKPWADLIKDTYVDACSVPSLGYTNQFGRSVAEDGLLGVIGYPSYFDGDVADLPVSRNPSIEGGAYITAPDYGKILLMHLRGGECDGKRVLSNEAVARMQEDRIGKTYNGSTIDPTAQGYGLGWWIDRHDDGVVSDSGLYGAVPWMDNTRHYAAFVAMESNALAGPLLRGKVQPILEALFDAAETAP